MDDCGVMGDWAADGCIGVPAPAALERGVGAMGSE